MSEEIIKIKSSVTGLYESIFVYSILISYHTDFYQDDCSSFWNHFNMISKPPFVFILFIKILELWGLEYA